MSKEQAMRTNFCLRVFVLLLTAWPVYATASDRYVSPTGVDTGDCTKRGLPCATIQYAVDQTGDSDTIKVSHGKYVENLEITSAVSGLKIQGGWNSDFSTFSDDPGLTRVEGQSGSVINVWEKNSQKIEVTIEGFTINNGNAPYGGGVRLFSIDGGSTAVTIKNNIIVGNQATEGGGGIYISANNGTTTVELANNVIKANTAQGGGGISVSSQKKGSVGVIAANNMIVDNKSTNGDSGHGAFISADDSTTTLVLLNTTIAGNVDSGSGTGLFIRSYRTGTTTVNFRNSIVWGNENSRSDSYDMRIYEDDSFGDATLVVSAANSDIGDVDHLSGSYILEGGIINQDPVFADPSEGNYRLRSGSPAIDAAVCGFLTLPDLNYVRLAPYNDYEGDARPGDGVPMKACDMGADEFMRMAAPSGTENWTYPATTQPAARTRPAAAKPIGVGSVSAGGPTLSLKIGLAEISGQVDIYLALFAQHIDPENAYLIKSDLSLQVLSRGTGSLENEYDGGLE